jgi:hypothetical protein
VVDEALIERVLKTRFPSVRRMYARAIWLGVVHEDDLLSDYSLGVLNASEIVSDAKETHPEDFLHYRGLLEVQRHQRVSRQKSTVSQCQSGHIYSFNKGRTECPKCNLPFEQFGKFLALDIVDPYAHRTEANITLADYRDAVQELDVPEGQKRILKAMVSDRVVLSEDHIISATAKLTGVSRQRVHQVLNDNRPKLRALLAA